MSNPLDEFRDFPPNAVVAVGAFDGVHLGHRKLLETARDVARFFSRECVIVTFVGHPKALLAPAHAPDCIYPPEVELAELRALGIPRILRIPFTPELAATPAETFAEIFRSAKVYCGADWRFGKGAFGTPTFLYRQGIDVQVLPYAMYDEKRISSTRIRALIQAGRMSLAALLLGKPWHVSGEVIHGRHLATPTFGTPTLNIAAYPGQVKPATGVYPAWAQLPDGSRYPAVVNFGTAPTVKAEAMPLYEAHLIGFEGDLYGQTVTLSFPRNRLRGETHFPSLDALKAQILADREAVKGLLL